MKKLILMLSFAVSAAAQVPVTPIIQPHMTFVNAAGTTCAGCSLYSYAAGSTTPQATYTDSAGTSQNTNPVIMGADGGPLTPSGSSGAIWLGANAYKLVLIDAANNTVFTVDNVRGGGLFPCGPAGAIQIANSAVTGLSCDSSITINTTSHAINVGTLPAGHVTIGALGTPTSWIFDTTTPATALTSLGGGVTNAGTLNQLAFYAAAGTTISGTSVIPTGITGTTQSPSDNTAKLATTAYVALPGAIAPASLVVGSGGTAMTGNQGNGVLVQHSTGTITAGDLAKFDMNGNTVDAMIGIGGSVSQPSRLFNVVYQNTNPVPMLITITGNQNSSGCTDTGYVGSVSASVPPSLAINYGDASSTPSGSFSSNQITLVVPASWYYGATTDFCFLVSWTEAIL